MGSEKLSDAEREELLQLYRQRLDAFREQRGEEVFAHRSRHRTPISGSIKVRVLTRAKGRCECCGVHEHQRALEVAPIIPRNQGGSDFRGVQASYGHREAGCVFCALKGSGQVLLENAFEAVHRRCLFRERGAQPDDPASAWGRRCFMRTGI